MERNQVNFLKVVLQVNKKFHFILKEGASPKDDGRIRLQDIFQVKQGRKVIYDANWWHEDAPEICVKYVPGDCDVRLVQGIKKNMPAPKHSVWCYNGQAVTREFTDAKYEIAVKVADGSIVAEGDFYHLIKNRMEGSRFTEKRRRELEMALYRLASGRCVDTQLSLRELIAEAIEVSGI